MKKKSLTLIQITDHCLAEIGGSVTLFFDLSKNLSPFIDKQLLFVTSSPKNMNIFKHSISSNSNLYQIHAVHSYKKIRFLGIPTFLFLYAFNLIRILRELNLENNKNIVFVHCVLLGAFLLFWRKMFGIKMPVLVIDAASSHFRSGIGTCIKNIISLLFFSLLNCDKYSFGADINDVKRLTKIVKLLRINYDIHYYGIDTDYFKPSEKTSDQFIILFPHRLDAYKQPDLAIKIFQQFINNNTGKDIKLFFVGGGPEYYKIKKFVILSNIEDKVIFFGYVEQSKMKSFYNLSDVFIGTSLKSNYGLAIQEAMSCAKPVVIFEGEFFDDDVDLVEHGLDGFKVKNGDINEFVNHIQLLYENNDLRKVIGINARNKIIKKRSKNNIIKNYVKIMNELYNKEDFD